MSKILALIRWYTNNRAIVALLALIIALEIIFIARIVSPSSFQIVLDNHVFELIVLLALAQVILLLFRLLDRAPGRVYKDEHECQVLLREVVSKDTRARRLYVLSCGLASRLDMIATIHKETKDKSFFTKVLIQSPAFACDREDAKRTESNLIIWDRDHSKAPVEMRYFETPATIRALVLCDQHENPFWGVASWYTYERLEQDKLGVVGRRNPSILLRVESSTEDQAILIFLMDNFKRMWQESKESYVVEATIDDKRTL